jgi:hypothetical protein
LKLSQEKVPVRQRYCLTEITEIGDHSGEIAELTQQSAFRQAPARRSMG